MRLIDADKLAEYLGVNSNCDHCSTSCRFEIMIIDVCNAIEYAPTVEPKKGEWFREDGSDYVTCSECGDFLLETEPYNFCPCCGADMRGESE